MGGVFGIGGCGLEFGRGMDGLLMALGGFPA